LQRTASQFAKLLIFVFMRTFLVVFALSIAPAGLSDTFICSENQFLALVNDCFQLVPHCRGLLPAQNSALRVCSASPSSGDSRLLPSIPPESFLLSSSTSEDNRCCSKRYHVTRSSATIGHRFSKLISVSEDGIRRKSRGC